MLELSSAAILLHDSLMITSPVPIIAEQDFELNDIGLVRVYVPGLRIYIVFEFPAHPEKLEGNTCTFVGTQLELRSLVYAVEPGVPSPNSAYVIFPLEGC